MTGARPRLDSRLEAEGAEFLVLGHLLIEGIQATKAYTRYPGYDLIAMNPQANLSCRIQVKSRWMTDYDGGFPLKSFETDFLVFVALNRGYRYRKAGADGDGRRAPDIWVFPIDLLRPLVFVSGGWSKLLLRHIENVESFRDRWDLIRGHLQLPART